MATRDFKKFPFGCDRVPRVAWARACSFMRSSSSGLAFGRSRLSCSATQTRSDGVGSRSICVIEALYGQRAPFLIGEHQSVRQEDFDRLYAEHAEGLFGFLVYRTGDRVLAEDLVADTFERVLRARRRFDRRKGSEKTWIYTVALNRLRDLQRRAGAERRALERAGWPPEASHGHDDQVEHRDAVARAMGVLSDEERDAIALRFGAELTVPEIAKLLDEPLTTVEGRVYRALRKLRDALERPP